ncbi:MAG: hypothetical protein Q4G64_06730 [bacterium]|nr:hypothetical protein [bacterium]
MSGRSIAQRGASQSDLGNVVGIHRMPPTPPGLMTLLLLGAALAAGAAVAIPFGEWLAFAGWAAFLAVVTAITFLVSLRGAFVVCERGVLAGTLLPFWSDLESARWEQIELPTLRYVRTEGLPSRVRLFHFRNFTNGRVEASRIPVSLRFDGPAPRAQQTLGGTLAGRLLGGSEAPLVHGEPGSEWRFSCGEKGRARLTEDLVQAIGRHGAHDSVRIATQLAQVTPGS